MSERRPLAGPDAATSLRWLWLVPVAIALHNAEEALAFPGYLPVVRAHVPEWLRPVVERIGIADLRLALAWATLLPLLVVAWATGHPGSRGARWAVLLVVSVMALNVVSHAFVAALVLRGYAPGLATAVLVVAPMAAYVLRRGARERWIARRSWMLLPPAALLVHGPGLIGLLLLA